MMPSSTSTVKATSTPRAMVQQDQQMARDIAQSQITNRQIELDDRQLAMMVQQEEERRGRGYAPPVGPPPLGYMPPLGPPPPANPFDGFASLREGVVPPGTFAPPREGVVPPGTFAPPREGVVPPGTFAPPSDVAPTTYRPPTDPPPGVYAPPAGPPPPQLSSSSSQSSNILGLPSSQTSDLTGLSFPTSSNLPTLLSPALSMNQPLLSPLTPSSSPKPTDYNPFRAPSPQNSSNPFLSTSPSRQTPVQISGNPFLDPPSSNPFSSTTPRATIDPFALPMLGDPITSTSTSSSEIYEVPPPLPPRRHNPSSEFDPLITGEPIPSAHPYLPPTGPPPPTTTTDPDLLSLDLAATIALEEKGSHLGFSSTLLHRQQQEHLNLAEAARIAILTATEVEDELLTKRLQEMEDEEMAKRLVADDLPLPPQNDDEEMARRVQQELEDEEVARRFEEEERAPPLPRRASIATTHPTTTSPLRPTMYIPQALPTTHSTTRVVGTSMPTSLSSARQTLPTAHGLASRFFPASNRTVTPSRSATVTPSRSATVTPSRGRGEFERAPVEAGLPVGAIVVPPGEAIPEGYVYAGVAPSVGTTRTTTTIGVDDGMAPPPYTR